MEDFEMLKHPGNEEKHSFYKRPDPTGKIIWFIGLWLLIAFISPIVVSVSRQFKPIFLNIEALTRIDKLTYLVAIQFLYPLIAGVAAFSISRWERSWYKAAALIVTGTLPVVLLIGSETVRQAFNEAAKKLPANLVSSPGWALIVSVSALSFILAAAHAARVNPARKAVKYAAALGGALYFISLLIPVNNEFSFITPFKLIFTRDTSGTGIPLALGFVSLASLILMTAVAVNCFIMLKAKTEPHTARLGKRIIVLWVSQLSVFAVYFIYLTAVANTLPRTHFFTIFLVMLTIAIKIVPWILGLFLMIPLGIAEFLLLPPTPKVTAFFGSIEQLKSDIKQGGLKSIKSTAGQTIKSPRFRYGVIIVIVAIILFAAFYRSPRNPRATRDLFIAAENGNLGRVKRLIKDKADINAVNRRGQTPLHLASKGGHLQVVRELLRPGGMLSSKQSADLNTLDIFGRSALYPPSRKGNTEIVRLLVAHGADPDARGKRKDTPLIAASGKGHTEIVRLLIKHGADVDIKGSNGDSALFNAISFNKPRIVKILIENGADIHTVNNLGENLLHLAVMDGSADIVKALVSGGVNVNARDSSGATPFHKAVFKGNADVVRFFIKNGSNVNKPGLMGFTPLHVAAESGHLEVARVLINEGAFVNMPDIRGNIALHFAVKHVWITPETAHPPIKNKSRVIQLLIDRGASIDKKNRNGNTPLLEAVVNGIMEEVKVLVENGADVHAVNEEGETVTTIMPPGGYYESRDHRDERRKINNYLKSVKK